MGNKNNNIYRRRNILLFIQSFERESERESERGSEREEERERSVGNELPTSITDTNTYQTKRKRRRRETTTTTTTTTTGDVRFVQSFERGRERESGRKRTVD